MGREGGAQRLRLLQQQGVPQLAATPVGDLGLADDMHCLSSICLSICLSVRIDVVLGRTVGRSIRTLLILSGNIIAFSDHRRVVFLLATELKKHKMCAVHYSQEPSDVLPQADLQDCRRHRLADDRVPSLAIPLQLSSPAAFTTCSLHNSHVNSSQ